MSGALGGPLGPVSEAWLNKERKSTFVDPRSPLIGDHGALFAETGEAKKAVSGHICSERRSRSSQGHCEQVKLRKSTTELFKTTVQRNQENEPQGAHGAPLGQLSEGLGKLWGDLGRHRYLLFRLRSSILERPKKAKKNRTTGLQRRLPTEGGGGTRATFWRPGETTPFEKTTAKRQAKHTFV